MTYKSFIINIIHVTPTRSKNNSYQRPGRTIWEIITTDEHNVKWLAEFGDGNIAQTDWREGSRAVFIDGSGSGLIAEIRESRPFETILIRNVGIITDGQEDTESEEAIDSREFFEKYTLTPENEAIRMSVEVLVEDDFYDDMSDCWERALAVIRQMAEGN